MSYDRPYHGGGGHRRRYKEDHEQRREVPETPEQKLRSTIIKLGEVDPVQELPRAAKQIREQNPISIPAISEGFRIGVTEQPYKIPYYAALLRLLYESPDDKIEGNGPSLGKQILEDFWKGFQAFLDTLAWREMRLCIHFFAHLTVAEVVSADSFCALLRSFTLVLDEFGVSYGRAKRAALCVADGLIIGVNVLQSTSGASVTEIINAIQTYNESVSSAKWLVNPHVNLYSATITSENADELLDIIVTSLNALGESDFREAGSIFPQPYGEFPNIDPAVSPPFSLPSVLVPPEIIELDALSVEAGEDTQVKKEEWPEYFFRLFDNEVTPDPNTPSGYALRSALLDIIDIFEINRKECARLLLEYPKWTVPGTFKPKADAPVDMEPVPGRNWQLENTIIEVILGTFLILPEPAHKPIYYISLITELCKLSPPTVGPAVGKSIRKLYGYLAEGLDVDVARRFAEWLAVHMSNFGFQWVWKEWVPDLVLATQHPKRTFMRRAIEFEMRLSYHDRILKSLPEAMQAREANVIPEEASGPVFEYDDPDHTKYEAAQSILNLFRGRSKAEDVIAHVDSIRHTLEASWDGVNVDIAIRSIVVQSLLHIGSRSFSHLLNAIERYLPLLRNLVKGGDGARAKADILDAVVAFWKRNRQMIGIVFDKLMQYQIVDPGDVVAWTFANGAVIGPLGSRSLGALQWDLLKGALDKANGRVMIARRKVTTLRKEEDDTRARAKAREDTSMDVDTDTKPEDDGPVVENPALTTALKAFASLTREQKGALSKALDGFVLCLVPTDPNPDATRTVLSEQGWLNRANWDSAEWNAWETWQWYRHFCRAYSPYLRNYATTLSTISFARLEGSIDPTALLVQKIWKIAIGQE